MTTPTPKQVRRHGGLKRIRQLRQIIEDVEAFKAAGLPITAIKHLREGFKPELNLGLFEAKNLVLNVDGAWDKFKSEWM